MDVQEKLEKQVIYLEKVRQVLVDQSKEVLELEAVLRIEKQITEVLQALHWQQYDRELTKIEQEKRNDGPTESQKEAIKMNRKKLGEKLLRAGVDMWEEE